nr:hypothetical protein [Streptomyces lavendulae]
MPHPRPRVPGEVLSTAMSPVTAGVLQLLAPTASSPTRSGTPSAYGRTAAASAWPRPCGRASTSPASPRTC